MRARDVRDLTLTFAGVFVVLWTVVRGGLQPTAAAAIALGMLGAGPGSSVAARALHSLDRDRVAELLRDRDQHLEQTTRRVLDELRRDDDEGGSPR